MGKYTTTDDNGKKVSKKSGSTHRTYVPTKGANKGKTQLITNGWFIANKNLMNVTCVTSKFSKLGDKGWIGSVSCEVVNTVTGEVHNHWGSMQKSTGKVVIDKMNMVVNPKAANGGYCGSYIRKQ
jgi:hypothetical protein